MAYQYHAFFVHHSSFKVLEKGYKGCARHLFRELNMKKLLFCFSIIALVSFASCTKETTYTFVDNTDYSSISATIVERTVYLMEYDVDGSRIANNSIDFPSKGHGYTFTANDRSEKIKVYLKLKFQSGYQTTDFNRWVQLVYYLEKGKDVTIQIDGSTLVGPSEP